MKVKTSITLSQEILDALDELAKDSRSRSAIIEDVLRKYFADIEREIQDKTDIRILNESAKRLNKEAMEVLSYQVEY